MKLNNMKILGKVWKSETDKFWLVEIPALNLMTQAATKKQVPSMIKDAIELLMDDPDFSVKVTTTNDSVILEASDTKKITALILKRKSATLQKLA